MHDLPIYTCNPGDFAGVEDLQVVAVPVPTARVERESMLGHGPEGV